MHRVLTAIGRPACIYERKPWLAAQTALRLPPQLLGSSLSLSLGEGCEYDAAGATGLSGSGAGVFPYIPFIYIYNTRRHAPTEGEHLPAAAACPEKTENINKKKKNKTVQVIFFTSALQHGSNHHQYLTHRSGD